MKDKNMMKMALFLKMMVHKKWNLIPMILDAMTQRNLYVNMDMITKKVADMQSGKAKRNRVV